MSASRDRAYTFVVEGTAWIIGIFLYFSIIAFAGSQVGLPIGYLFANAIDLNNIRQDQNESKEEAPKKPRTAASEHQTRRNIARVTGAFLQVFVWFASFSIEATTWMVGNQYVVEKANVIEGLIWCGIAAIGLFAVINVVVFGVKKLVWLLGYQ